MTGLLPADIAIKGAHLFHNVTIPDLGTDQAQTIAFKVTFKAKV